MECQLRIIIHNKKSIYDDVVVTPTFICEYHNFDKVDNIQCDESNKICDIKIHQRNLVKVQLRKRGFNAYLISAFINCMSCSSIYRKSAVEKLMCFLETNFTKWDSPLPVIFIRLKTPCYQFIDYSWNYKLTYMIRERVEIEHAMSWLSTLGGAFSSLGDKFDHCAKLAGKISVEQFKLALRLGDPQLVARCELYAALSLLQLGHFRTARRMVRKIFKFAVSDKDVRLQRMCQGVWAKLKYCCQQRKQGVK